MEKRGGVRRIEGPNSAESLIEAGLLCKQNLGIF
jgi:hypothetical protein